MRGCRADHIRESCKADGTTIATGPTPGDTLVRQRDCVQRPRRPYAPFRGWRSVTRPDRSPVLDLSGAIGRSWRELQPHVPAPGLSDREAWRAAHTYKAMLVWRSRHEDMESPGDVDPSSDRATGPCPRVARAWHPGLRRDGLLVVGAPRIRTGTTPTTTTFRLS